jgi:hypothetical protein
MSDGLATEGELEVVDAAQSAAPKVVSQARRMTKSSLTRIAPRHPCRVFVAARRIARRGGKWGY